MQIKTETAVGLFILAALAAFFYLSFQIGFFRFDQLKYIPYDVLFKDAAGLTKKSDVKISGVKVGWVESVDLSQDGCSVLARLMILKKFYLTNKSQATVKQDGLLGFKYVDIKLIDEDAIKLQPGQSLKCNERSGVQEDLMSNLSKIANDIEAVSSSIKNNLGLLNNVSKLKETIDEFNVAAKKISSTSQKINEVVSANENNLMLILNDIRAMIQSLKENMPQIKEDFLPKLKENVTKVTENFDQTSESVKKAANEIHDIARKINRNTFFGSLMEESNRRNFKATFDNIGCCVERLRQTTVGFDNYHEFLFNLSQYNCQNYKTHLNFWIHPNNCYFLMGGTTFSRNGFSDKKILDISSIKDICQSNSILNTNKSIFINEKKTNHFSLNLQAGGYFKNFALRLGFFESTPGLSLDYLFPITSNKFSYISSLQVYDFTAKNHVIPDLGPQLKWINRMFFTPNFYFTFGLDDITSSYNRSAFFGFALNFGDTYFKLPFCW